jgi:hypothetical protein
MSSDWKEDWDFNLSPENVAEIRAAVRGMPVVAVSLGLYGLVETINGNLTKATYRLVDVANLLHMQDYRLVAATDITVYFSLRDPDPSDLETAMRKVSSLPSDVNAQLDAIEALLQKANP